MTMCFHHRMHKETVSDCLLLSAKHLKSEATIVGAVSRDSLRRGARTQPHVLHLSPNNTKN
jgi:hypothetical protein